MLETNSFDPQLSIAYSTKLVILGEKLSTRDPAWKSNCAYGYILCTNAIAACLGAFIPSSVLSLEIANQVVQRCKLPYVVLVNAMYGLGQMLISLNCTMNIAIQTKWCKRVS